MPTEEIRKKFATWFKMNYPQEYHFFTMIESNLDDIYSSNRFDLHEGEFAQISLSVRKNEGNKYHLTADPFTSIFLGVTCKTIKDEISNYLINLVSDQIRREFDIRNSSRCVNCDASNLATAIFCNQCGKKLKSNE